MCHENVVESGPPLQHSPHFLSRSTSTKTFFASTSNSPRIARENNIQYHTDPASTADSDDDMLDMVEPGSRSGSHLPLLMRETEVPGIGSAAVGQRQDELADATDMRYLSFFILSAVSMTLSLFDNAWIITASQVGCRARGCVHYTVVSAN